MPAEYPQRLIAGGRIYRVAGTEQRSPRWEVTPVPSQLGDPMRERVTQLGDGSAGIIGSHRHGARPSPDGVADVTNGDTSVEDRYGAGPQVVSVDLSPGNAFYAAGSIGGSLMIGEPHQVETLPVEFTVDTAAYASEDSVGGAVRVRNGLFNAGMDAVLTTVTLQVGDTESPDFDVFFFDAAPTLIDNAAFSLTDAERETVIASTRLTDPVADANGQTYQARVLIPVPGGAALHVAVVARGAVTFSGTDDLHLSLGFQRAEDPSPSPSIGSGSISDTPTAIWADGPDDFGDPVRYVYVVAGGRIKVVDPTDDSVEETTELATMNGGDAARWAGQWWIARRGDADDYVQYVSNPFDGTQTVYSDADFTAINIHSGPDALYRAYNDFAGNTAIIKKTTSTSAAAVAADANWAPSSGETMADPGTPVTRLSTLGEDLVVGKRDGLFEFDATFTPRVAIEWMKAFAWEYNCNAILPLGSSREVIVSFRRGLYYLPVNRAIGTEVLTGNETDKKGRYTAIEYDGNWIYAFLESPTTDDTHIVKMRPRRTAGPGLFEHHPVATLTDTRVLTAYLWPGGTIGGTRYGPRLYFGNGSDRLGYIRLGETQPDVLDPDYRFTTGSWSIQWPHDDFGTPQTPKLPYKVECSYEGVTGTAGITWTVSADDGAFVTMDSDGSGSGVGAVTTDGFAQRFGRRDNSVLGRELVFRMSGAGGSATEQQRVVGSITVTLLEQPEMVDLIDCHVQLQWTEENPQDAEEQWRTLKGLKGQVVECIAQWGDEAPDTTFYARVAEVSRDANVTASEVPGVIIASLQLRALDFA